MRIISFLFPDLIVVAGYCSLGYGLYQIHQPSAFIVCGLIPMWAFWPKKNANTHRKQQSKQEQLQKKAN